ncbi:MAG: GNAT family N-acetyltransferase [Planctomycetaceae bacterium]|nr:GNAT family N-acetyltransferase [Planctomycetaceae bacterium]
MPDVDMQIAPVPARHRRMAMGFVAAGRDSGYMAAQRASALRRLFDSRVGEAWLWWVRQWGRCQAAAMILAGAGRTGMLYYSPPGAPGVDEESLTTLLATLAPAAMAEGPLSLVQAACSPEDHRDVDLLRGAGFELLAELIYMRLDLATPPEEFEEPAIVWRRYGQFTQDQLAAVIKASYEQSLDCPPLRGRRQIADVIAGHKASGAFSPKSWWIAFIDEVPAGCVLVNASHDGLGADVVYLGVAAAARGKGLGRKLLSRAAAQAYMSGYQCLTLAVDAGNTYAMRLYQDAGFREQYRRVTYAMFPLEKL